MVKSAAMLCAASAGAILFFCAPSSATTHAPANKSQNAIVSAELLADVNAVEAGQTFRVGVRLKIADGWRISWTNPGDAGLAPTVRWLLPDGFVVGLVDWPHPSRIGIDGLVVFAYEGEVVLSAAVDPPAALGGASTVRLMADVGWLALGEEFVPGQAVLLLELPVGEATVDLDSREAIDRALEACAAPTSSWRMEAWHRDDRTIVIEMQSPSPPPRPLAEVAFFPYEQDIIENAAPQRLSRLHTGSGSGGYRLTVERSHKSSRLPRRLRGVLVARPAWDKRGRRAFQVDIPVREAGR